MVRVFATHADIMKAKIIFRGVTSVTIFNIILTKVSKINIPIDNSWNFLYKNLRSWIYSDTPIINKNLELDPNFVNDIRSTDQQCVFTLIYGCIRNLKHIKMINYTELHIIWLWTFSISF